MVLVKFNCSGASVPNATSRPAIAFDSWEVVAVPFDARACPRLTSPTALRLPLNGYRLLFARLLLVCNAKLKIVRSLRFLKAQ
jgi:hypothetical protein